MGRHASAGEDVVDDDVELLRRFALPGRTDPRLGLCADLRDDPAARVPDVDLLRVAGLEPEVSLRGIDYSWINFDDRCIESVFDER